MSMNELLSMIENLPEVKEMHFSRLIGEENSMNLNSDTAKYLKNLSKIMNSLKEYKELEKISNKVLTPIKKRVR